MTNNSNAVFDTVKAQGPITAKLVAEALDISVTSVRRWLDEFVANGTVRKTVIDGTHGKLALYHSIPLL